MTVLRGPTDPDHFRVKQGRYNDRWYADSLPACPIADATDDVWPSWSTTKGASGKDWSFVTTKRIGHTPTAELHRIADLEPDQRTQAFNAINKNGLTQAGGRGTIIHLWAEDLLAGRGPRLITDPVLFALKLPRAALEEALEYIEALAAFFDHYQPEVVAAEYVAIHRSLNGHGYGCTPDVIAWVQGQIVGIDWKSRGADSDHGAYPEEAAQIAAGAKAEYMIIQGDDGTPRRSYLPVIDCGIVVSIKPDGCRVYPTDIDAGFRHVEAMHAFWVARLTEKAAVGKPWPPTPINQQTGWPPELRTVWPAEPTEKPCLTTSTPRSTGSSKASPTSGTKPTPTTSNATTRGTQKATPPAANTAQTTPIADPTTSSTTPNGYTSTVLAEAQCDRHADHGPHEWPGGQCSGNGPFRVTPTKETLCPTQSAITSPASTNSTATSATSKPRSAKSSNNSTTSTEHTDNFDATSKILAEQMLTWTAELRQYLKDWWPDAIPTPGQVRRGEACWTDVQLKQIEQLCDLADAPFTEHTTPVTGRFGGAA